MHRRCSLPQDTGWYNRVQVTSKYKVKTAARDRGQVSRALYISSVLQKMCNQSLSGFGADRIVSGRPGADRIFGKMNNTYVIANHVRVPLIFVDSHIQRIVLATEETTVTQQVSHRPIKCQSGLWSQRGTKVNGSHHGDNPLLRPTEIEVATKSYATLQVMVPTNIKTVHQTSLLHIESSLYRLGCRLPTTSVLGNKADICICFGVPTW